MSCTKFAPLVKILYSCTVKPSRENNKTYSIQPKKKLKLKLVEIKYKIQSLYSISEFESVKQINKVTDILNVYTELASVFSP